MPGLDDDDRTEAPIVFRAVNIVNPRRERVERLWCPPPVSLSTSKPRNPVFLQDARVSIRVFATDRPSCDRRLLSRG